MPVYFYFILEYNNAIIKILKERTITYEKIDRNYNWFGANWCGHLFWF